MPHMDGYEATKSIDRDALREVKAELRINGVTGLHDNVVAAVSGIFAIDLALGIALDIGLIVIVAQDSLP